MIYETIKILSRKKGLSINQLEKTLGLFYPQGWFPIPDKYIVRL